METPVLSEKHQKKTLSAKKTQKQTIKNILASPYRNYWPLLTPEESQHLRGVLEDNLPHLNRSKVNVPWSTIKSVPRELRKEFRGSYNKTVTENKSRHLLLGVNEVTRHLENGSVACVLIASDVNPRLLVKHIVDMSITNGVPILIVGHLREVLKSSVGFASVVMAISETTDANLQAITTTVVELSRLYPVPKSAFDYERHNRLERTESAVAINEGEADEMVAPKSVYLYRKNTSERVFVPVVAHTLSGDCDQMDTDSDFVALDETRSSSNLRPLIIKRVRSNKNRNKTKIERLKLKKKHR